MSEGNNRVAVSTAYLESDTGYAAFPTNDTPAFDSPVCIRVISYRARLTDPDGVSVKAVLDGLIHAGILADDTSKQVKEITFENRKSKIEKTIIQIEGD